MSKKKTQKAKVVEEEIQNESETAVIDKVEIRFAAKYLKQLMLIMTLPGKRTKTDSASSKSTRNLFSSFHGVADEKTHTITCEFMDDDHSVYGEVIFKKCKVEKGGEIWCTDTGKLFGYVKRFGPDEDVKVTFHNNIDLRSKGTHVWMRQSNKDMIKEMIVKAEKVKDNLEIDFEEYVEESKAVGKDGKEKITKYKRKRPIGGRYESSDGKIDEFTTSIIVNTNDMKLILDDIDVVEQRYYPFIVHEEEGKDKLNLKVVVANEFDGIERDIKTKVIKGIPCNSEYCVGIDSLIKGVKGTISLLFGDSTSLVAFADSKSFSATFMLACKKEQEELDYLKELDDEITMQDLEDESLFNEDEDEDFGEEPDEEFDSINLDGDSDESEDSEDDDSEDDSEDDSVELDDSDDEADFDDL